MKLFIIRHGEKIKDRGDISLSLQGKNQALLTGKYLKSLNIDLLISSLQKRALKTAQIIGRIIKKNIQTSGLLNERISYGDVPNQSYKEYLNLCSTSTINRSFILPNGETSIKAGKRFEKFIKPCYKTDKKIVVVSHTGIIADFLRNNFNDNLLKNMSPYFSNYYAVEYCSLTEIEIKDNIKKLIKLGSTEHLKIKTTHV